MALRSPVDISTYTTKIIKAGALIPDTLNLLAQWDPALPARANLERVRDHNLLGKASRARLEDILAIFSQRYLRDPQVARSLATLVQAGARSPTLVPILYFYATRSDALLHDVVTEYLAQAYWDGNREVSVDRLLALITNLVRNAQNGVAWSAPTTTRVIQGLLATLRDFGILV